jgi:hypothetical protein
VATPLKAYRNLLVDALEGKGVIDMMNYYPIREGQMPILDTAQLTSSELVQQHLKGARVVKGLNNQDAPHLFINARRLDRGSRTTLPIAGDDNEARETVIRFMDAIDFGPLSESWRMEPGTPIYVWPYAPKVPDGLSGEEGERWYSTTPGTPVATGQARELIARAVRRFPMGGFPRICLLSGSRSSQSVGEVGLTLECVCELEALAVVNAGAGIPGLRH